MFWIHGLTNGERETPAGSAISSAMRMIQYWVDGERFNAAFEKRLGIFGLELNRSKTKLLEFGRFAASNRRQRQQGKPECFVFLGLTHICSTRPSGGGFAVKRITSAKKMTAKLKDIRRQPFKNRSKAVYAQGSRMR